MKKLKVQFNLPIADHEHEFAIRTLGILIKEVLQQTPPEMAKEMAAAARNGREIVMLGIRKSYGCADWKSLQCAFWWERSPDPVPPEALSSAATSQEFF